MTSQVSSAANSYRWFKPNEHPTVASLWFCKVRQDELRFKRQYNIGL